MPENIKEKNKIAVKFLREKNRNEASDLKLLVKNLITDATNVYKYVIFVTNILKDPKRN